MNDQNERFDRWTRDEVSKDLKELWLKTQPDEPDLDKISEALDETDPGDGERVPGKEQWFKDARKRLGL